MNAMRRYPNLYELNSRLYLRQLGEKYRRGITISQLPDEELEPLAQRGFDMVWFMGVWQRSFGSRKKALMHTALRLDYDKSLPDWTDEDVAGSPYAIYSYALDSSLGQSDELLRLKQKLNRFGVRLILDFVPNHLAYDHPWILSHPDWFVQGKEAAICSHPDWFFSPAKGVYLAHGRDPNFGPWSDTVQLNLYSQDMRRALIAELTRVAQVCDGVRCDMAMLVLNDIYEQIWGQLLESCPRPSAEFWSEAISEVRARYPDFLFLAEAYWGRDWTLQNLGFDYTYDKTLYDRLRSAHPGEIRSHLRAEKLYQERSLRFIENHDEPRAITAFGREPSLAAAVVMSTVPGAHLFHDGQMEGKKVRLPIQLVRAPIENPDAAVREFYQRLLAVLLAPTLHEGKWTLLQASETESGNLTFDNILTWSWQHNAQLKLVVVNYSPAISKGRLRLPSPLELREKVTLYDELSGKTWTQNAPETISRGLYLELSPWQSLVLDVIPG